MILVTGATGNVGRQVVKFLLDNGEQVGRSRAIQPLLHCPPVST